MKAESPVHSLVSSLVGVVLGFVVGIVVFQMSMQQSVQNVPLAAQAVDVTCGNPGLQCASGRCPDFEVCADVGGSCQCVQDTSFCGAGQFPACETGSCPNGGICELSFGSCFCNPGSSSSSSTSSASAVSSSACACCDPVGHVCRACAEV